MNDDDIEWVAVGHIDEWPKNSGHLINIGARRISVYRVKEQWYAIKDVCPHAGVSLCAASHRENAVMEPTVVCPAHAWAFDLRNGKQVGMPGASCSVATYPARVNGETVEVGI